MSKALRIDRPREGILRVRLNRPARLNAINVELLHALQEHFASPREQVIIISSTTDRAFSAGGDLTLGADGLARLSDELYDLYRHIVQLRSVVIAAASGYSIGAGTQLLLCADLRVLAPEARIRFSVPERGIAGTMWSLPGLVGRSRAMELILTGRYVTAEEALALGLANVVHADPDAAALELANRVLAMPADLVASIKRVVNMAGVPFDALWAEQLANVMAHCEPNEKIDGR